MKPLRRLSVPKDDRFRARMMQKYRKWRQPKLDRIEAEIKAFLAMGYTAEELEVVQYQDGHEQVRPVEKTP